MSEIRNLVIGCDGTWNEPEQTADGEAETNVIKFMDAIKQVPGRLRKFYEKGVGTRAWEALPGGIYGYGLEKRVQGGYRFLCNRFRDPGVSAEDNRVFIVGFSRGAYTARRLAGLVNHCGLPQDPDDVELGWEVYQEQNVETAQALKSSGRFFEVPIEMVGVWDTVKATNDRDYKDDELPANVVAGYHAMAIDERRKNFPVLRWKRDSRVLEAWFAGVHSDVGGGYARAGLSDVALRWMIFRARGHGLPFKKRYLDEKVDADPRAKQHESLKGIWKPLGESVRTIRKTDFVHRSVEKRLEAPSSYAPKNLPESPRYWPPARAGEDE